MSDETTSGLDVPVLPVSEDAAPVSTDDAKFLVVTTLSSTETTPADPAYVPPPPPPMITLADILAATEVVKQKEIADKALLETIGAQSFESLRTTLIQWGVAGFPNAYPILTVPVTPPPTCSDGVQRSLSDYIAFCSGKTIDEHVAVLQAKLNGMTVMYANFGNGVTIVISKA